MKLLLIERKKSTADIKRIRIEAELLAFRRESGQKIQEYEILLHEVEGAFTKVVGNTYKIS